MRTFEMIVNGIVIVGMFYLAFIMALAGWLSGLRKGEAVTLLPERKNRVRPAWAQAVFVLVSLAISALLIYLLWIPLPVAIYSTGLVILKAAGLALLLACSDILGADAGAMGNQHERQVKLL
jgi:hypothetical protein